MFVLEEPEHSSAEGKKPSLPRIMPWETLTDAFFVPPIPAADIANPFHLTLVNRLQPEPAKKPVEKPKETAAKEVPPKVVPPKVEPKKVAPPPKPDRIISIMYKGFYVDVAGNVVALITISDTVPKSEDTLMCKIGDTLKGKITLKSVSEENAVFVANEEERVIPWKARHDFHFKQE